MPTLSRPAGARASRNRRRGSAHFRARRAARPRRARGTQGLPAPRGLATPVELLLRGNDHRDRSLSPSLPRARVLLPSHASQPGTKPARRRWKPDRLPRRGTALSARVDLGRLSARRREMGLEPSLPLSGRGFSREFPDHPLAAARTQDGTLRGKCLHARSTRLSRREHRERGAAVLGRRKVQDACDGSRPSLAADSRARGGPPAQPL